MALPSVNSDPTDNLADQNEQKITGEELTSSKEKVETTPPANVPAGTHSDTNNPTVSVPTADNTAPNFNFSQKSEQQKTDGGGSVSINRVSFNDENTASDAILLASLCQGSPAVEVAVEPSGSQPNGTLPGEVEKVVVEESEVKDSDDGVHTTLEKTETPVSAVAPIVADTIIKAVAAKPDESNGNLTEHVDQKTAEESKVEENKKLANEKIVVSAILPIASPSKMVVDMQPENYSDEVEKIITEEIEIKDVDINLEEGDAKEKSFACLICNTSVEVKELDSEAVNIDYDTLSLIYRVDMSSEEFRSSVKEDQRLGSSTEHQFCKSCANEISMLQDYHSTMKKAVSKFEVQRDKLASGMLQTYLLNQEVVEEPLPAAKSGLQLEVLEKWKNIYTGKEDKEQEILWMVKQRESRTAKINKRIAKVKSSLRRTRHSMKDGPQPAKTMAQIQKAMTAAYFTPKLGFLRKKNRLFFKVPIINKCDSRFICPICDKVFMKKDTMTIHTRSHIAHSTGKLYKCSICDKVCSDRQKLISHRKGHSEEQKNMKCVLCDKTFYRKGALRNHLRTQHQRESFQCTMCDKAFATSFLLKRHVASHNNVDLSVTDMYSCKTCSKTFLKSKDLSDHLRVHEDVGVFGCTYCGKAFPLEKAYLDHLVVHQGGNPYICESEGCGLRFSSEALLTSHLKVHRPKDFTCETCGKACRSRDGLRKHDLTHTGNKPYSCQICDIGFIERKSFDAHMVKHTGKLPYKCNLCKSEEGFKDAKDIRRHKVEHHPEILPKDKSFPCEFCWHGFASPEAVGEHIAKVHERYKCHLCARVFKLGDHLRRHMYIHTGEKPYPCTLCSKTFNQESNLKEHMYRHTGTRPHKCPYCPDVGYLRRMHLKEHMMKEHGTDKVPTLPMGRAAHNARKFNMMSEEQPDTILGDVYPSSPRVEAQSTAPPEMVVSGIGGSSVYLKNLHLSNSHQQSQQKSGQGPLLMRALSGSANNAAQSPVFLRRIGQQNIQTATIIGKGNEQSVDIPTIKSDNSNVRYSIVSEAGDPNNQQQYIIFM